MAGEAYSNTDGAVRILDGGTPRIITVKAGENISGGYWVRGSGTTGVVGSSASTYTAGDIEGYTVATQVGSEVIGLALTDISSGTYGPCALRGTFLLPGLSGTKIGSIFSGNPLLAGSAGTVLPLGSTSLIKYGGEAAGAYPVSVGRALSAGAATGEFVIVSLNI